MSLGMTRSMSPGFEHHLVVLGLEQVGECLGPFALVERELEARRRAQVESDGERVQPTRSADAASAVIEPESMPPLRYEPTGTSATS